MINWHYCNNYNLLIIPPVADRLYGSCAESGQCQSVPNSFCDTQSDLEQGGFCQCRAGYHNVNHRVSEIYYFRPVFTVVHLLEKVAKFTNYSTKKY